MTTTNKEETNTKPTLTFNGAFLVNDETFPMLEHGVNRVCGYLAEKSEGLTNDQVVIESAINFHINLDLIEKLSSGEITKDDLPEATEKEVRVVVNNSHAEFEGLQNGEVVKATHEVRTVAVLSDSVEAENVADITELKKVVAKGVVMMSKDDIIPMHFLSTLLGSADFELEREGVSAVIIMHASGDFTVDAVKNEHIIDGVKLYNEEQSARVKTVEN